MKNMLAILATIGSVAFGLSTAAHADDISLGNPSFGGNGCPAGSVSTTISPDAKALSILFDNYQLAVGGTSGKSFDRKSCNVAIPVHVPQGRSISILSIDYRGFNHLPKGATAQFNVEYFFAGGRGPAFRKSFDGVLDSDYTISNELTADALVWSGCGVDVNLRTNSSIRLATKGNKEAVSSVDTEDVKAAIVYHVQWRDCQ